LSLGKYALKFVLYRTKGENMKSKLFAVTLLGLAVATTVALTGCKTEEQPAANVETPATEAPATTSTTEATTTTTETTAAPAEGAATTTTTETTAAPAAEEKAAPAAEEHH
jgi:hypothetical protein